MQGLEEFDTLSKIEGIIYIYRILYVIRYVIVFKLIMYNSLSHCYRVSNWHSLLQMLIQLTREPNPVTIIILRSHH